MAEPVTDEAAVAFAALRRRADAQAKVLEALGAFIVARRAFLAALNASGGKARFGREVDAQAAALAELLSEYDALAALETT